MAAGPLLLLTLGVTLSLLHIAECGVFVVAPNVLNANEQETVSVLVTGRTGRTSVTVTIQSNNQVHSTVVKSVSPDRQTVANVRVDGAKLGAPDENGRYYVQLRVRCAGCGNFDRMTDILVNKRTGTVFLQTDKPLYSPGQTVNIRLFALDEARKGVDMPIKMEIKNPQGIIISRKTEQTQTGLFTGDFKISSRPLHGFWKIVVHFGTNYSESREQQIEIKKYVLSHFQVKISRLPEYINSVTQSVEGYFEARYSFAANVVGKARVVFRIVTGGEATYLTDKSYLLHNGRATFVLDAADMATLTLQNLLDSKSHLQIEVIVTETSTGISEKLVAPKCHFVTSPYVISFEETPANFMPGLPFEIKITASYITGTPLPRTNLEISATDQQNRLVGASANLNGGRMTNSKGVVRYYFDMRQDITTIKIKVNVEGDLKKTEHVTQKAVMPSYMKISPHGTRTLKPGEKAQFEAVLTDSKHFKRLQFMLVSGGRIFDVGHEERLGMTILTFGSHISYNNAPSVRMVTWYFRTDTKELVAASTKVQVERKCKTEAEVKRAEQDFSILEPGATCEMIFKGTIGAKVATMVVDKSVYFMNNSSRLTRKTFFDEFESRDLGCAVGGGANATDVFTLAGLTVLSDTFSHPRRESVNCTQSAAKRRKRSTDEQGPDEETCCNAGKQFANTIAIALNSQRRRLACFRGAANFTGRSCKNTFGKCCVERATARAIEVQDHSRSQTEENDFDVKMIEDESEATPRTDFPESWLLLSNMEITNSGETRKTVTIPGSITTWVFQAVTMSTTEGMCVAEPFEQVVRKDLFLKLHLPHTAVLGEQMELAATVYNLDRSTQSVRVSFLIEEGLCSNVPVGSYSHQYQRVRAGQPWTARWPIVPTKTGKNKITVKLYSSNTPDVVIRSLNVVPSGDLVVTPMLQITQDPSGRHSTQQSWNGRVGSLTYRVRRDTTRKIQITTIPLKEPQDAMSDTAIMKVSLLGDVMTPIVEGFLHGTEKHLHKPRGCGEQTMAGVGPLVFTARYLRQQRKLTGPLEAATRKKVEDGVRRMLLFRQRNGGFAVWYNREPRTWLTAFTLKTFTQAREFTDIDNKVIDEAKRWLMTQNGADAMFPNTGIPHHKNMAGGAPGQLTLTAYIYISLLESGHYQEYQQEITRAMNSLAARTATENDPYTLAIVTYALAKFRHPEAETINQRLLTKARNLTGQQPVQTYWPTNPQRPSQIGSELEVETAAYGLLAQLALRHVVQCNSIVEWLLRQRFAGGLFKTTQSTVLSLQALAEYSAVADKDVLDMSCTLSFPEDHQSTPHVFKMNNTNRLVQQTHEVTQHIGHMLNINCKGTGVTHTTVETTYYSSKTQEDNCAFNITAKAIPKNNAEHEGTTIEICTSLKNATQKLFMPMVEVGLGTGFVPVEHTLESLLKQKQSKVDFYEVNDRSVVLYMDEIPSNQDLCLTFDVTREDNVNYTQPVPVKVYAYYEPDKTSCRTFYDPLGKTAGTLDVKCDSTEASCKCLENQCARCYGYSVSRDATPPLNTNDALVTRACSQTTDYVHAGVVLYSVRSDGELKHTIRIENVTKAGTEPKEDVLGQERVYVVPAKCPGCGLDQGRRFLIMGQDGPNKKVDGVREYQLTPSSYVVPLYNKEDARQQLIGAERRVNKIHKNFIRDFKSCRL